MTPASPPEWVLQLLSGSLLREVSRSGKQKARGGEKDLKVYLIPSARSAATHTMPESLILLLYSFKICHLWHRLPGGVQVPQVAVNRQRWYFSRNSPSPVVHSGAHLPALLSLSIRRNKGSSTPLCLEASRGCSATHRHARGAGVGHSPGGCQPYSDPQGKPHPPPGKN